MNQPAEHIESNTPSEKAIRPSKTLKKVAKKAKNAAKEDFIETEPLPNTNADIPNARR